MKLRAKKDMNYRGETILAGSVAEIEDRLGQKWLDRGWAELPTAKKATPKVETAAVTAPEKTVRKRSKFRKA